MANDLIAMVTTDHRELQRLFDMMKSDKSSRPLALPLAVAMLEAHSEAEEDRVYPAVAREAGEKEEAEHAAEEHHQAESLGRHLLEMDWESEEFDRALEEWVGAVVHHIEEEENEILPALGEAVGDDRLRALGLEFAARRSRKLAGRPLEAAGGDTDTERQPEAEGGTREELYEKARELGVEGRSSMNKEELAEEVRKAQDREND
ncbi:hemerythrin HHE cation-binding protein [Streptomyces ipomoeae]|uniref:Hemerythrin HHE cation binding domain protein n=2 Tax=Streptomyces ipomoeae TaxID=103232 RepID=L1KHR2_9ACTN|nr:Rho termination factor N-terminal domain-containing protein [Streptomyces ipomoeae]EKX60030.1 hemerythrin HHE cation binding domain protein [Streptomyces ipomoeae 91-03]MDX2699830.1 Rho termination factor N-terminal domain-containing protein [Streptomyces ipomoeae]MDX2820719.1 Rho termination factor N-terminal domain-containing protein [Streptomyces ipomoeae]MDX2837683.1 Rho termination factor N-terminal domain-containing protein [Streptomyces ipomoeae]MDX2873226.1 Rho termination factor N-